MPEVTIAVVVIGLIAVVALWLLGAHLVGEWTLADRYRKAKRWCRWFWCALRSHPYDRQTYGGHEAYEDWMRGNDPFRPPDMCSHCGKVFWR